MNGRSGPDPGLELGQRPGRRSHPLTLRFALRRWINWALNLVFPDEQKNCLLCHRPMPDIEIDTTHTMFEGVCLFCLQDAMDLYHQELSIRYLRVPGPDGNVARGQGGGGVDGGQADGGPEGSGVDGHVSQKDGSPESPGNSSLRRVPVLAAAVYEGLIRTAIRQWKYDGVLELTTWFAQAMVPVFRELTHGGETGVGTGTATTVGTTIESSGWNGPGHFDAIVPVPSSADRFKKRGYDHVLLLATSLEKELGIPVASVLLRKSGGPSGGGFTQSQTAKSARERLAGLSGSYKIRPGVDVSGQRVVLLDDIVTTGATLYTCAQALYEAGAKEVIALVLADVK